MLNENIRSGILSFFTRMFKEYAVRLEIIPDEPDMIGIGVYGVANENVAAISDTICDSQELFPQDQTPEFIPLVRNLGTTRKYYPSLLTWTPRRSSDALSHVRTRVQEPGRPGGRPGGRRGQGGQGVRRGRPAQRGGPEAGMEDAQGTGESDPQRRG
jgi:hypothetical protein